MDVRSLILASGDSIAAEGVIVTDGAEYGLLLEPSVLDNLPGVVLDQAKIARLTGVPAGREAWPAHPARLSVMEGTWNGSAVHVTSLLDRGPVPAAGHARPRVPLADALVSVLRDLEQRGLLTGIELTTTDSGGANRSADVTATDPKAVEAALSPFFDSIQVYQAIHSNSERMRLQESLGTLVPAGLLASVGESPGEDHQPRVTASLKYVTTQIAEGLEPVPSSLLKLTVYLQPSQPSTTQAGTIRPLM